MSQVSVAVPDKFLKPFYKVTLGQLLGGKWDNTNWQVALDSNNVLPCYMVWVQGTIIDDGNAELTVQDSTGQAKVVNTNASPGGVNWVKKGLYIQVLGQILGVFEGKAHIKCTKMVDMSDNSHSKQMWDLEVSELQNVLCGKVVFSD